MSSFNGITINKYNNTSYIFQAYKSSALTSTAATCHRRGGPKYALADHNTALGRGSFPNDYNDDGLDDYLNHRLVLYTRNFFWIY